MTQREFVEVDPALLRVHPARPNGADPAKLQRQIARFGKSTLGMPALICYRAKDGELVLYDGVTRATRVAKLLPRETILVEVVGHVGMTGTRLPTVKDLLP